MSTTYNALAAAIAQEENSQWPNNPGALMDTSGNKLTYPDYASGYQALLDKLTFDASGASKVYSPSMSLADFEKLYTGGDPNAASNIGSMLGVPTSTTLGQLSDQSLGTKSSGNWLTDAWNKYMDAASTIQNNAIDNPNVAIAGITGTTPEALATGKSHAFSSVFSDIVAILVGLVLIAGAIFSFSTVKDTIVTTAKDAAALAA